jgi:NAD(P)-dependent dehydrogenase (short-subunit alcohol dehydrogenase family)
MLYYIYLVTKKSCGNQSLPVLTGIDRANVLIVGATQGIGLGFVRALLPQTNIQQVFATYRQSETASELLDLSQQYGDRLKCLQVDVTLESQIAGAIKQIKQLVSELHLVIYCVGVLHEGKLSPEKFNLFVSSK